MRFGIGVSAARTLGFIEVSAFADVHLIEDSIDDIAGTSCVERIALSGHVAMGVRTLVEPQAVSRD